MGTKDSSSPLFEQINEITISICLKAQQKLDCHNNDELIYVWKRFAFALMEEWQAGFIGGDTTEARMMTEYSG